MVEQIVQAHKPQFGNRHIMEELQGKGYSLGRQQVRSLISLSNLKPIQPKSFVRQRPTISYD